MNDGQRRESKDMSALFGFLRRRGLIVLLAAIVGAVAGYLISSGKSEEYTANASLLLRGTLNTTASNQAVDTFAPGVPEASQDRQALATADPVKQRAIKRLSGTVSAAEAKRLVDGAQVSSGEDASSIQIEVTSGSPKAAAEAANGLALGVIDDRRDRTVSRARRALRAAQSQLPRRGATQVPTDTVTAQRVQQLRQIVATADGDADLATRATTPGAPSSPRPKRDAVIGGFAGLLLGFVLAMVREQLDRRLKSSRDLEDLFDLPVLANIPRSRAFSKANGAALEQLPPAEGEAFQMLRANLRFLPTDKELRSVVVTSPGVGDGKSTIAMNLAKADAAVGKKVILIEADMRRPKLGSLMGIRDTTGLATYLADPSVSLVDVSKRVPVANRTNGAGEPLTMDVVVSGSVPGNPSELINSERMLGLLDEATSGYDLVVVDTAPVGVVADAIPLMSKATAVVIVGRVGRITSSEADALRAQLQRIDAPTYGLVANFADGEQAYGYY